MRLLSRNIKREIDRTASELAASRAIRPTSLRRYAPDADPVGDSDAKTATPSTYRPVGPTCPSSCPYLGRGCYAQAGNVRLHEQRASGLALPSIRAAMIAIVSAHRQGTGYRLHVSGDFGTGDRVDREYVLGLAHAVEALRAHGIAAPGWSYTHFGPDVFETSRLRLLRAGIVVRYSDRVGPLGAIVAPFDRVPSLRRSTGARVVKCPAQVSDATCAECRLCWERPELTIAFDPHGPSRRKVAALAVIQ